MDLSIIFVNWNSTDYLHQCIESIYECTTEVCFEIIVVDNASPKQDAHTLQERFPDLHLIKSSKNLGFAGANNLGYTHSSGSYVLFLNPDTRLVTPAIDLLMRQIRLLPNAGIVGCKLLNSDLSLQVSSIQRFPTIMNQVLSMEWLQLRWPSCPLWRLEPLFSEKPIVALVEVIPGACMLLKREVFSKCGMFSEDYFMYAEDIDLNYKVKQAGFSNYYVGEAAIIHYGGGSSARQSVSHWNTIMRHRAMQRYYRKTRGRIYQSLYRVAMGLAAVGRLLLLGCAYLLGDLVWEKQSIRTASGKWKAVLEWATGKSA